MLVSLSLRGYFSPLVWGLEGMAILVFFFFDYFEGFEFDPGLVDLNKVDLEAAVANVEVKLFFPGFLLVDLLNVSSERVFFNKDTSIAFFLFGMLFSCIFDINYKWYCCDQIIFHHEQHLCFCPIVKNLCFCFNFIVILVKIPINQKIVLENDNKISK